MDSPGGLLPPGPFRMRPDQPPCGAPPVGCPAVTAAGRPGAAAAAPLCCAAQPSSAVRQAWSRCRSSRQVQLDGPVVGQRLQRVQDLGQPQEGRIAAERDDGSAARQLPHVDLHMRGVPGGLHDGEQQAEQHALEHVGEDDRPAVTPRITASPRCSRHSCGSCRTGTSFAPACTSTAASAASGTMPERRGEQRGEQQQPDAVQDRGRALVRAPACTLAALRTITAVIGSAPSIPQTVLPAPCAISSLS